MNASGLNAANGSGGVFVAEGDESDGAILTYTPHGAVITNIDADHLDHYGTVEAYTAGVRRLRRTDRSRRVPGRVRRRPGCACTARRESSATT